MRTEIGPDEAEAEGFGGTKVEAENEVWPDFHPSDTKPSPGAPDLRRSSLLELRKIGSQRHPRES